MLMGRIQSLKEAIFGVAEETDIKKGAVIINRVQQDTWIRPVTSFANQLEVFNNDALVRQAVIRQASEIIGAGFFTQLNPKYTVELPSPIEGFNKWTAKEAIDYFNQQNNVDEIAQTASIELVACGNSFLSVPNGLRFIPLEAVEYAQAREKTTPIKDEYKLKLTATYDNKSLEWGSFIHFRANMTTKSAPFGQGIIEGLMKTHTWTDAEGNRISGPTPLELRHSTRRSMMKGFEKFSFGNELWSFPEASDPAIDALNEKVKTMKDTGERVVTNAKGTVQIAVPQRTTSYDEWLKATQAEFNSLLEDPALKIHTETIFAKATAEEETKLFQKKVLSMQRVLKRQIEALWFKCLKEWGFDPVKAQARMNFGAPVIPEYNIQDILKAEEQKVIDRDEARQMLREARWKIVEGKGGEK